jgi:hypothetical protein
VSKCEHGIYIPQGVFDGKPELLSFIGSSFSLPSVNVISPSFRFLEVCLDRFSFGVSHTGPALLKSTRATLESFGFVCTVEVTFETRHRFELHTLVAVEPKKLNPVKFTRAGE